MGSVYKRGSNWWIRYDLEPNPDGTRNEVRKSCKGMTEKQAKLHLAEMELQVARGISIDPTSITVGEYLSQWLDRQTHLSPYTIDGYESSIRIHISPAIGRYQLDKLKPIHLQNFYDELQKKYSTKTVKNIHGIIHGAFSEAVMLEIMYNNPADRVKLPQVIRTIPPIADEDELGRLIAAINTSKYRIPILLAIGTGARRGEILALKWEDIDLDREELILRRAAVQAKSNGRKLEYKGTKTNNNTIVVLPPVLVDALTEHKAIQEQRKMELGENYHDLGFVCAHNNGLPFTPGSFADAYARIKRNFGIKTNLHGLRHTLSTEELVAGVPSEIVSKRRGHANIQTTHNIYGHAMPRHQKKAVDVAEKLLNSKPKIRVVEN